MKRCIHLSYFLFICFFIALGTKGEAADPVFREGTSTTRSISENVPVDSPVGLPVVATDADGDTLYYWWGYSEVAPFSVDSQTGQIRTDGPLDYEWQHTYTLSIYAVDRADSDPHDLTEIEVTITVLDVDEPKSSNAPVFREGARTTRSIWINEPEDSPNHAGVPVVATDADGDTLTYFLSGPDSLDMDVDSQTGQLSLELPLSWFSTDTIMSVIVTASDGSNNASIAVTISFTEQPPPDLVVDSPFDNIIATSINLEGQISRVDEEQIIISSVFSRSSIGSVAFSPDGVRLATGGVDGNVLLWNANTGKELRVFIAHTDSVVSVAFSSDNTRLVTGSTDGTARLWNANTGKQIRVWERIVNGLNNFDFEEVRSVAFSPDGYRLAIGTYNAGAQIWNANTGALIHELNTGSVSSLAFRPDGKQLVTSGWPEVQLWNTNTGKLIRTFGPDGSGGTVAFSPDGNRLATAGNQGVHLWNTHTGERIRTFESTEKNVNLVFSPDGKQLATGSFSDAVQLWNANTGKEIRSFVDVKTTGIAFSPDGVRLATGDSGTSLRIWDLRGGVDAAPEASKVVSIPDANLASAVRKALGLGNNAPLTKQQLLKLTELDARDRQIKTLTGLGHAQNLTRLDLFRNDIRDLNPLSWLTRLKNLNLEQNPISDVGPLTKLKQLEWLLLGDSPIKNAGVRLLAELKHLKGLSLYRSEISNITPLAKLTKLESLWLDYNQIRDVSPLSGLTRLRTLYLRENQIRNVSPLAKLTELTELRLADNPIADVGPLASLRNLKDVDIEIPPAAPTLPAAPPPEVTQLLGNYPNPFNPETWIPYQLANSGEVRMILYDARGTLIRRLELGHQREGYYTSRSRAAYWDGRNEVGEKVASGVYFYTLTVGDFTATRKMLIRK